MTARLAPSTLPIWRDDRGVWVRLTPHEVAYAAQIGAARHVEAENAGLRPAFGYPPDRSPLGDHVDGAAGEMAVAKWLGRYFDGTVNTFHAADLGSILQVRTRSRHEYELLVRERDPDEHFYLLATGTAPLFCLRGYVRGADAKRPEYLRAHGGRPPAFFVPHADLIGLPLNPRGSGR